MAENLLNFEIWFYIICAKCIKNNIVSDWYSLSVSPKTNCFSEVEKYFVIKLSDAFNSKLAL